MAISTVQINGSTIMTVADSTAQSQNVASMKDFYAADGSKKTGSAVTGDEDVLFIDYDGTELYGYSKADFLALTEMPPNPTHTGLTAQGWNWTLADAKEYVTACNMLVIGQHYVTDDGKTRVYLDVSVTSHCVLKFIQTESNGVTVNWGDGSAEETFSGTGGKVAEHYYNDPGNYVATLNVTSGSMSIGHGTVASAFYGGTTYYRAEGSQMKKIEIGSNVSSLTAGCMQYCQGIEAVTIPSSISVNAAPFNACYKFKCFIEPSGIIGTNTGKAFSYGYGLKYVSLPKSHTTINDSLFEACSNLRRIHFPLGATTISKSVCYQCRNLKYVTYSNVATSIKSDAFGGCFALKYITPLPSTITELGTSVFADCLRTFESVNVPSGITVLSNSVFYDTKSLKSITIPNTVTSIGTAVFAYCCSLERITLPSSVTSIDESDFSNCCGLQLIDIQGNITTIPKTCFNACYSLCYFECPSTVTSIATKAFQNAVGLQGIFMNSTNPPTLESDSFSGCTALTTILVPYGCGNAYKTATNWSSYASIIVEMPNE